MLDPNKISLLGGAFTATKDDKGKWIYKASDVPFKKNGTLNKKYHDLPRYKLIGELERELKNSLKTSIIDKSVSEIIKQLEDI